MHFNGQKFSVVSEQFSFTSEFLVKTAKIHFFGEKMDLSVVFLKIEVYVVANWSTRLEKH